MKLSDNPAPSRLFKSFWMAGFESSCHINRAGRRLDLIAATQHDRQAEHDYVLLKSMGIKSARDGVRWHLIDRGGKYDFSSLEPQLKAAERHGVQVVWNLLHYGWPDDLDLFSPAFIDRFARFCGAVAHFLKENGVAPLYTPINEISFLAWAAGQVGYFYPFARWCGGKVKRQLVQAFIAGSEAIWEVEPQARLCTAEPVIHTVPPRGKEARYAKAAARKRASQFEAWDMLSGRVAPELGGHPRYLDVIGVNFYHDNQWQHPGGRKLGWDEKPLDDRWMPVHRLLAEVWERYKRPLFVAETSHFGSGRAAWLRHITAEVQEALLQGIPLEGVCVYPILDRPDWDKPEHWHNSGLWDLKPKDGRLERVLNEAYAAELRRAQRFMGHNDHSEKQPERSEREAV